MPEFNQELYNIDKYRSVVSSTTATEVILTNTLSGTEDKMVITANGSLSAAKNSAPGSITISTTPSVSSIQTGTAGTVQDGGIWFGSGDNHPIKISTVHLNMPIGSTNYTLFKIDTRLWRAVKFEGWIAPGSGEGNGSCGTIWFYHKKPASSSFQYSGEWASSPPSITDITWTVSESESDRYMEVFASTAQADGYLKGILTFITTGSANSDGYIGEW
jgi:hypothetical protein